MPKRHTVCILGILLKLGDRYLCWNSYEAAWFLGPRRLSEIFAWDPFGRTPRLNRALQLYPAAQEIVAVERPSLP